MVGQRGQKGNGAGNRGSRETGRGPLWNFHSQCIGTDYQNGETTAERGGDFDVQERVVSPPPRPGRAAVLLPPRPAGVGEGGECKAVQMPRGEYRS